MSKQKEVLDVTTGQRYTVDATQHEADTEAMAGQEDATTRLRRVGAPPLAQRGHLLPHATTDAAEPVFRPA